MKTMKTIKATANHSQRTFTLRSYNGGKLISKYRTVQMSRDEFNSCLYNTNRDWNDFLKSGDYYAVK